MKMVTVNVPVNEGLRNGLKAEAALQGIGFLKLIEQILQKALEHYQRQRGGEL